MINSAKQDKRKGLGFSHVWIEINRRREGLKCCQVCQGCLWRTWGEVSTEVPPTAATSSYTQNLLAAGTSHHTCFTEHKLLIYPYLSCWTFLKAQHLSHIWCKQMFCPLAWPGATLGYRSHYVLSILYLKREEARSFHLLLPWDRERTQNRPRWQLVFKRPCKEWCQGQEIYPSGENASGCQEDSQTTSCPACFDFSEQPIQKASLAISRHTLSFTLGRHPSGRWNTVFSIKNKIMKAQKHEHPPSPV